MHNEDNTKHMSDSSLGAFSPKQTFLFGLVGGILILCTVGFFVLLGVMLSNDAEASGTVTRTAPAVNQPTNNQPTAPGIATKPRAVDEKEDHIRGAKNAKVTVIEYSDFECPFCARFHPTMQRLIENYPNDVRWVYRHFPLESIHPKARPLAVASECASEQGKFWEFADAIIEDTGAGSLESYATKVGLNYAKLQSCVDSGKYDDVVSADAQEAVAAGGQGTPFSVIIGPDGEMVPLSGAQPYEAVEAAVKNLL